MKSSFNPAYNGVMVQIKENHAKLAKYKEVLEKY
jgi:hypothetical protein